MVFASSVATTMIEVYKVSHLLFTGVAGGLKPDQKVGDLVLGADVVNYEFDCRAFTVPFEPDYKYQLGELPFLKWRFYEADARMLALAMEAPQPAGVKVSQPSSDRCHGCAQTLKNAYALPTALIWAHREWINICHD